MQDVEMLFLLADWASLSMRTQQYTNMLQNYSFFRNNQQEKPKKFNLSRKNDAQYTLMEDECPKNRVLWCLKDCHS